MSTKQHDFIVSLVAERDVTSLSDVQQAYLTRLVAGEVDPPSDAASRIIESLLALPRKAQADGVEVPEGYFAVSLGGRNTVEFFRVDRPQDGKWSGWTFVKQQASDDWYPVKGARKDEVLAAIAADPLGAMQAYGLEIGSCGRCNRTLTDDISREMGIGPDCAQILGIERPAAPKPARRKLTAGDVVAAVEAAATPPTVTRPVTQLTELPGETWEDIFK